MQKRLLEQFPKPAGGGPGAWPLYVVVEKILGANEPLREDFRKLKVFLDRQPEPITPVEQMNLFG